MRKRLAALWIGIVLVPLSAAPDDSGPADNAEQREIDPWDQSASYRTLRAGEGFRTSIFGFDVDEKPRDRRSTSAFDLGAAAYFDGPEEANLLPFASLYFWRRPDDQRFLRATVGGLYNDVIAAHSFGKSPFEAVFAFENNTVPFDDNAQWVDGERNENEELRKMWVRGGVGVGYRRQLVPGWKPLVFADGVDPQRPDNMFSIYLLAEPKYLYFSERNSAPNFVVPQDTFELDGRLAMRWDSLERNLMDLAHRGFAVGFDATYGWRTNWEDWGLDRARDADEGRHPKLIQAYAVGATGLPWLNERHRLISYVHGGRGWDLDRFSQPRVGGGPSGNEYMSLARPILPGAAINEFTPDKNYVIGLAEYRYELMFFAYLSAYGGVAYLDRERLGPRRFNGPIESQDDVLYPVGARLTSGFLFRSQLQLEYNYNFDVIRHDEHGGGEVVVHVSRAF
jgi:hypothetical protein